MSEDKLKFWQTPEGKIISHGLHEHVNAIAIIGQRINFILRHPEEYDKEKLLETLRGFQPQLKRSNDAMDYVYEETKKLKGY